MLKNLKKLGKYFMSASAMAAAMGMAAGASAQNLGTPTLPNFNYASELNYNSAATPAGTPATQPQNVTTLLGFGVSSGQNRYIRYRLFGATFHNAVLSTMLQDQTVQGLTASTFSGFGGNTSLTDGITVVSGGAPAGQSCVVFQVTGFSGLGGRGNSASDVIMLDGGNTPTAGNGAMILDVPSTSAPVTMEYSLHETGTSASCTGGTNASLLAPPVTGPVATFINSVNFSTTALFTDTADVSFSGGPFEGWAQAAGGGPLPGGDEVNTTNAGLSAIVVGIVTPYPHHQDGVNNVALNELASAITMTVQASPGSSANFAASSTPTGLTLDTGVTCGPPIPGYGTPTLNASMSIATFTLPVGTGPGTGGTGAVPDYLCYHVNGTTPINAGGYSATLTMTPLAGVTLESIPSIPVGTIVHNGTQLSTPWFTIFPGYTSRFVLTNSGTTPAPYTTVVITESGVTATPGPNATGTIPAGHTLVLDANTVTSAFSSGTRGSITFSIAAPPQSIMGEYQSINASNGSIDTYKLHNTND